jgi:hypothetical protein
MVKYRPLSGSTLLSQRISVSLFGAGWKAGGAFDVRGVVFDMY